MNKKQWLIKDFEAGDLALSSGKTLRSARLHYHQIGELNAPKDNLILLPTYYGGAAAGNYPWAGQDSPLDPDMYCIVIPSMLGAGESSSPSNTLGQQSAAHYPSVSLYDQGFQSGHYQDPPEQGLKAFGRVYAGWAYSQAFFRHELWRHLGFNSIEALLQFWEHDHLTQDANNLLTVLNTWQGGDISDNPVFKGDYNAALAAITMPTRMMPSTTDLYFTAEDAAGDAVQMPGAKFETLASDWGHIAGGAGREQQSHQQILAAAQSLLCAAES